MVSRAITVKANANHPGIHADYLVEWVHLGKQGLRDPRTRRSLVTLSQQVRWMVPFLPLPSSSRRKEGRWCGTPAGGEGSLTNAMVRGKESRHQG